MHLKDADLSTSDANVQAQPDIFPSGEHITAGFTNPTESTQVSHQCLICWFQPFRLFVSELESSQNSAGSCGSFRNRNHQPAMPWVPIQFSRLSQTYEAACGSQCSTPTSDPAQRSVPIRLPRRLGLARPEHCCCHWTWWCCNARITAIKLKLLGTSQTRQTRLSLHFFIKWAFLGTAGLLDGLPTFCVQRSLWIFYALNLLFFSMVCFGRMCTIHAVYISK